MNAPRIARPSPETCADAAVWLARLRGPNRVAEVEEGFRQWLSARPEHATAFEMATETWDRSAGLQRRPLEHAGWKHGAVRMSYARAMTVAATVAGCAILGTTWYLGSDSVFTRVGEQRTLALEDGSRVHMNTDTCVIVLYTQGERRIRLEKGEALFDVARQSGRPFIVEAGDRRIRALGTTFVVRREARDISVTLVEGKVAVAAATRDGGDGGASERILDPGERLTLSDKRPATLDRPVLDKLMAWQRGQIAFDNTLLAEAVDEMNRYSSIKLEVEMPETAAVRVSGLFRTGDAASFAHAMAETYRVGIVRGEKRIVLSGSPAVPLPPASGAR
jgi:transmembrane sensor